MTEPPATYVVLDDLVSFRDPADPQGTLRENFHFLYAKRGETLPLGVSAAEIQAGLAIGALDEQGGAQARYAQQGLPAARSLRGPVGALPLSNQEQELQLKAAMSATPSAQYASQTEVELHRLSGPTLITVANALGLGDKVNENSTKDDLVQLIVGARKDAAKAEKPKASTAEGEAAARREADQGSGSSSVHRRSGK